MQNRFNRNQKKILLQVECFYALNMTHNYVFLRSDKKNKSLDKSDSNIKNPWMGSW